MADKQTNLHPKNDTNTNLKPNIITGNIPDKAVTLEKLDQNLQNTLNNFASSIATNRADINKNTAEIASNIIDINDNTESIATNSSGIEKNTADIATNRADINKNTADIATNRADINKNTAEIGNLKASVNTGTFDPTSDNPASQKSVMDAIIEADLNARFSRVSSGNLDGAFGNLSSYYSGKFHLLRQTNFAWGLEFKFDSLFAKSEVAEIDNSICLNDVFEHAGSITMSMCFMGSWVNIISATYSLRKVSSLSMAFRDCTSLKSIKLRDYPVSFDISASTSFEESDLVEILNNLMDLTGKTSQTLTMGATNLAKLTDAEKAIATQKNWVLA